MGNDNIFNKLEWSCQKATELIDKKLVIKLSFKENLQLKVHKGICDACRTYEKQSRLLQNVLEDHLLKINIENIKIISNNDLKINILNHINEKK
ncbi:MAG: hypothetical protein H6599_05235 [Flavobacteriales bacterium]|nr:hypothetical protein [Flavobacteriales bacterium]